MVANRAKLNLPDNISTEHNTKFNQNLLSSWDEAQTDTHLIHNKEFNIIYPSKVISVSIDALESDLVVEQWPEVVKFTLHLTDAVAPGAHKTIKSAPHTT